MINMNKLSVSPELKSIKQASAEINSIVSDRFQLTTHFVVMSFLGKIVLITGASSGIGATTAVLFSKEGAKVVLVGRNEANLEETAKNCDGETLTIQADVTVLEDIERAIKTTIDIYSRLDVLVNNAGIVRYETIFDENLMDTFDELVNTNLRAVVNITRLAVPHLVKAKGNIINISSVSGKSVPVPKLVAYSVTKAGLDIFTKGTAMELASHGVRVNAISPGPTRTDILKNYGDETPWECFNDAMPLGKICEAEDIANLVLYLASDKAKSITGADYVIDNGMLLK